MSIAILAEKPSVARDIARVVGAKGRGDGHLHGNGYVVSWAIGHLVALPEPHRIRPEWRRWRPELLPMLPEELSNGLCSLLPGEDRLVQTVVMDFTKTGKPGKVRIADGVIRSAARLIRCASSSSGTSQY